MNLELSVILIMCVVIIYILFIKIFSLLFQITGITKDKAYFQAISLLTGCGFTTSESEIIVGNKARRNIGIAAMITGNFFSVVIVSLIVNLFSSFTVQQEKETYIAIMVAFVIFVIFLSILKISFVKKFIENILNKIIYLVYTKKQKHNILTVLDIFGNDAIVEINIKELPLLLNEKSIHESKIKSSYSINILSIKRGKRTIDIKRNTIIQKNDIIVVFGNYQNIKDLFMHNLVEAEKILDDVQDLKRNEIDLIDNYGENAMVEIKVNNIPEILINHTLKSSLIKEKYGINIMMIKRNGIILEATRDAVVEEKDTIIVYGNYNKIKTLFI